MLQKCLTTTIMSILISITEAAQLTGISVSSLRRGVHSGRFPVTRANLKTGKLLFNVELLQEVLRQEAYSNLRREVEQPH